MGRCLMLGDRFSRERGFHHGISVVSARCNPTVAAANVTPKHRLHAAEPVAAHVQPRRERRRRRPTEPCGLASQVSQREAETKYLANGTPATKFSVATKKSWKDENDD
jgi:hypothetical protein